MFEECLNSYKEMWKKIFYFKGRTSKRKYWLALLMHLPILIAFYILISVIKSTMLSLIFLLFFYSSLIACISMATRRMHDVGRSGWAQLSPMGISYALQPSQPEENQYGKPEDFVEVNQEGQNK